jgi:hypothetical protein
MMNQFILVAKYESRHDYKDNVADVTLKVTHQDKNDYFIVRFDDRTYSHIESLSKGYTIAVKGRMEPFGSGGIYLLAERVSFITRDNEEGDNDGKN